MAQFTPRPGADRNLLYGVLALQLDFISRDGLVTAMHAWVLDKGKPLGQILQEQGSLSEEERDALDRLVDKHLHRHNDCPEKSLAAISTAQDAREALRGLADPDLNASLAHVAPAWPADGSAVATVDHVANGTIPGCPRYCFLRPHARGGLGEVFVARDTELGREVALKEIRRERADDACSRSRFLREARVNGALEHPGIVPVYSLGTHADGRPFYAMRFIEGDSLREAIQALHGGDASGHEARERTPALRQLLRRLVDVCNAIAYAHSRGVLHRDLKPGNIMLGRFGETLVVDWGLARLFETPDVNRPGLGEEEMRGPSPGNNVALTQTGTALGTPAYMPPEQAEGRLDALGPASDVYGLGATLYCLLTGRPPFPEGEAADVLAQVRRGAFPRPCAVRPDLPKALEGICLKAMALRPDNRYGSVAELGQDIQRWLDDQPVRAWPEPWNLKLRRWCVARKLKLKCCRS